MIIKLEKVSKRYSEEWVLKNVSLDFSSNVIYGIQGANGSGKSTLVKLISGFLSPSAGQILYKNNAANEISRDDIYKYCTFWGPHVNMISKLTIDEMITYFFKFKSLKKGMSIKEFYTIANMPVKGNRLVESLSSGQAQRLGLALSILADSELLLLDEPGSFLDEPSLTWLYNLIEKYAKDRIVIIASNEENDLALSQERINVIHYK